MTPRALVRKLDTYDPPHRCQACGRRYPFVYRVPDNVWRRISPKPGTLGGLLCPDCANSRACEAGLDLFWEAAVGRFPTEEEVAR